MAHFEGLEINSILVLFIFLADYVFLGYPLLRYRNKDKLENLFYSHILSVALMALISSILYYFPEISLSLLYAALSTVTFIGMVGFSLFTYDIVKRSKVDWSWESVGILATLVIGGFIAVNAALTIPFRAVGDAYGYYVPISRYINDHLSSYSESFYHYFLLRNFGYYSLYGQGDLLTRLFQIEAFRLLPIPFVIGTIIGVLVLSKQIHGDLVKVLATSIIYIFSIYYTILVKYNMFYIGNIYMISLAIFHIFFLKSTNKDKLFNVILALSTFSSLLTYDFSAILVIPFLFACLLHGYGKLGPYLAILVYVIMALSAISIESLPLEFVTFRNLDLGNALVFVGLLSSALVSLRLKDREKIISNPRENGILVLIITISAFLLFISFINKYKFGTYAIYNNLTKATIEYIHDNGWFTTSVPNLYGTLLSLLFSDVFFGWGVVLMVIGVIVQRGTILSTYFLIVLTLISLVLSYNAPYFRWGLFLGPLIVIQLVSGLSYLSSRWTLPLSIIASFATVIYRGFIIFPSIDYEHRIAPVEAYVWLQLMILLAVLLKKFFSIKRYVARYRISTREWRQTSKDKGMRLLGIVLVVLFLVIGTPFLISSRAADHYIDEIYPQQLKEILASVLPILPERSKVLTLEVIWPNFGFYKNVETIMLSQPWILDYFFRLNITNSDKLMHWLRSERIQYIFIDEGFIAGVNQQRFSLFQQLINECTYDSTCSITWKWDRFVLLEIRL